jgi:hypothetical protein
MSLDNTTKITSKICTGCSEEKPLDNYHKKTTGRLGRESRCKLCISARDYKVKEKGGQEFKDKLKRYYQENAETIKAKKRLEYLNPENKKKALERRRNWAKSNPTRQKEYNTKYFKTYYQKNREYYISKEAERRARKLGATPDWLTKEQKSKIVNIYKVCKKVSSTTGKLHHVDHIVPLQGENICGLHVPWNLAIIPAKANLEKGNKFLPQED